MIEVAQAGACVMTIPLPNTHQLVRNKKSYPKKFQILGFFLIFFDNGRNLQKNANLPFMTFLSSSFYNYLNGVGLKVK